MKPRYIILMVGMNLLWAASYPIFKFLSAQMPSGALATLRFGVAAVVLLAAWRWIGGQSPRWSDAPRIVATGVMVFCLAPRLQIEGVHRGQAGDTSLLMGLDPLITALAAALFLREKVPSRRWWGCALGMIGVVLLSRVWSGKAAPMRGLLANTLFIASFFCESAYSVFGKPILHRCNPLKLLGAGVIAGTLANLLLDTTLDHGATFKAITTMNSTAWLLVLYLGTVCTVVGYALWYVVIRETQVNVTGLTVLVQPLAGLLISVIWLGERLHWGQLWGSVAIVIGLAVGMRRDKAQRGQLSPQMQPDSAGISTCPIREPLA
ncbi:MAG TPA: DMT family transporter [Verrucomicrobiae bacterium]|nr:DMT family transporter [Verrucomicrobiae bacterium]